MFNKNISLSDVKLTINKKDLVVEISNSFLSVKFNKSLVVSLYIYGKNIIYNLLGKKTFVLDWNGGKEFFVPNNVHIIEYSNEIAHISFSKKYYDSLNIEYHYIVTKNVSGIYSYVFLRNEENTNISFSELRTVYRFDNAVLDRLNNSIIDMKSYLYSDLQKKTFIQDETWQLENGLYYSKYDLAGYVREVEFYGVYGNNYGAWLVNPSREYYSGGPLKQDLLVHQDSLMLNYLTSTHFGTSNMLIPKHWQKIYGPWLIYFNKKKSYSDLILDVKDFAKKEKLNWPYKWIKDNNLNIMRRQQVKGNIINNNIRYKVVLCSSLKEYFDVQTLGYLYSSDTDLSGNFKITNILSGEYNMYIYPISGYDCNFKWISLVNVNDNLIMKDIKVPSNFKDNIIWSIGETNRKSDNYKFSNKNRNFIWHTLVPKNINFYIGRSNYKKDWFYAQTKKGVWKIYFFDTSNNRNRILNIGIAATSNNILNKTQPSLKVFLNNILLKHFSYENDKSIYRGALQSGNFSSESILIPSKNIITGLNFISLNLIGGAIMYDTINFSYAL